MGDRACRTHRVERRSVRPPAQLRPQLAELVVQVFKDDYPGPSSSV